MQIIKPAPCLNVKADLCVCLWRVPFASFCQGSWNIRPIWRLLTCNKRQTSTIQKLLLRTDFNCLFCFVASHVATWCWMLNHPVKDIVKLQFDGLASSIHASSIEVFHANSCPLTLTPLSNPGFILELEMKCLFNATGMPCALPTSLVPLLQRSCLPHSTIGLWLRLTLTSMPVLQRIGSTTWRPTSKREPRQKIIWQKWNWWFPSSDWPLDWSNLEMKHGNRKSSYRLGDFRIKNAVYRGFPIAINWSTGNWVEDSYLSPHFLTCLRIVWMHRSSNSFRIFHQEAYRDTLVREMSGGWQMRVAIGKILLSQPDLILLDEPTNHVDLETVEFMEDLLREQEVAMVVVSHDRYFLNQICNRIVEISDGHCRTYFGNYVGYLQARDFAFAGQWKKYNMHRDEVKRLKKRISRLEERFLLDTLAQKKQDPTWPKRGCWFGFYVC